MLDVEEPGELEAFRDEIKKLAEINESLRLGVQNVEDLRVGEMVVWVVFKQIFIKVDSVLKDLKTVKDVQVSESLKDNLKQLSLLKKEIESNLLKKDVLDNGNRKEFLAWLKNRLVLSSNLSFLFLDEDAHEGSGDDGPSEDDLRSIKEFIIRAKKVLFV